MLQEQESSKKVNMPHTGQGGNAASIEGSFVNFVLRLPSLKSFSNARLNLDQGGYQEELCVWIRKVSNGRIVCYVRSLGQNLGEEGEIYAPEALKGSMWTSRSLVCGSDVCGAHKISSRM